MLVACVKLNSSLSLAKVKTFRMPFLFYILNPYSSFIYEFFMVELINYSLSVNSYLWPAAEMRKLQT